MSDRTFEYGVAYTRQQIIDKGTNLYEPDTGYLVVDADYREYWFKPFEAVYILDHTWGRFDLGTEKVCLEEAE